MNEKTILDSIHARAQGWLSHSESAELERELAADPTLRALAEEYRRVHALTSVDPATNARSRTSFEQLEPRLAARPIARRVAAAAALLLAGAATGWLAGRIGRPGAEPLVLESIELEPPRLSVAEADDPPARWSEYDPRGTLGVSFLTSVAEAEQLALVARRPLLVYGFYPGCPMAAALDSKVFTDPQVIELAERTVPVRIDLTQLPPDEQLALTSRGYPFLEVWRADGTPAHSLARNPDPSTFVESLHDGLAKSDATGEQPPWKELRSVAGRFVAARESERQGRMAEAEQAYRGLLEDELTPLAIAERAAAGLRRLSDDARESLLEACAAASSDVHAAQELLEAAVQRFDRTRFERDLRAALERLRRDGRFPALAVARSST